METRFPLFGQVHLLMLVSIPALAAFLAWWARRNPWTGRNIRLGLGSFLMADSLLWYGYIVSKGWVIFPHSLPLELCDVMLGLAVVAAFWKNLWAFELAYYGSLAGTSMAVLTPDLWEPFPSFGTVQYFLLHGGLIITVLFLAWSRQMRPRPRSLWHSFLALNVYAAAIGVFNLIFGTNYFYLRNKPESASLLDYFGPWPAYLIVAEFVALGIFALLWLPYRSREHGPGAIRA